MKEYLHGLGVPNEWGYAPHGLARILDDIPDSCDQLLNGKRVLRDLGKCVEAIDIALFRNWRDYQSLPVYGLEDDDEFEACSEILHGLRNRLTSKYGEGILEEKYPEPINGCASGFIVIPDSSIVSEY